MPEHYTDRYYTSHDGLTLHFQDYPCRQPNPGAPPLLCIPGLTRNCRDFAAFCDQFSEHYRIIAVDLRGRGLSDYDPDPRNYHPGTYLQDILSLLAHLELPPVILVGTSLGGLISMLLGALAPDKVAGIVLNDIGPEIVPEGLAYIKTYVGLDMEADNWDEAVTKTRALNERNFPDLSDAGWLRFTQGLYRSQEDNRLRLDYDSAIRVLYEELIPDQVPDLWPQFELIKNLPMLLIHGTLSNLISRDCIATMQKLSPTLEGCEVSNRGHAPLLDEPEVINALAHFFHTMTESETPD